ncbi:MAG: hypothetical protein IPI67_33215 [Myxococcales bacterium]|nr:hypothetical protein [Myxococcales bacterium]
MTQSRFALVVAGAVVLAACASKPPADVPETPAPSAKSDAVEKPDESPAASSAPVAEAPPKELKGCDKTLHDFDELLTAATFACKKDADCGCFPGQLSKAPGNDCGGVVEKATSKKLDVLVKDAKKNGCGTMAQCEPWTCEPICDEGRCQRGPRQKKK